MIYFVIIYIVASAFALVFFEFSSFESEFLIKNSILLLYFL